jgi:putative transposase
LSTLITSRGKGKSRLPEKVEEIVQATIENRYLTKQKLSVKKIYFEIAALCKDSNLNVPGYQTVCNRVKNISIEKKLTGRYDRTIAKNKCDQVEGSFPGGDYPLDVVQIDHTILDIQVVDEVYRHPIGRPWITMAIDVYSRMVTGFYISLDPPGALGTGLCISHSILPKDIWLTKLEISGKWPCYGIMRAIHMDNAAEFHGKMLERACLEYGIEINFRPVATPKSGGHIERLLGTMLAEIHALPGTTFSNPNDRKNYDPEGRACFTIKELEQWLGTFIINTYHQRIHSSLGTTPIARYNEGIIGNNLQPGVGQSRPVENELKLRLDFMPFVERTIQRYGVEIGYIYYCSPVLRRWILAYEQPHSKNKRLQKFKFKIDPRDISVVYFFDPKLSNYLCVPYRNITHPSLTIWEYRAVLRYLKEKGASEVNEDMIFQTYATPRKMEEAAVNKTASAKRLRKKARKDQATSQSMKNQFIDKQQANIEDDSIVSTPGEHILPFEDIDDEPFKR